MTAPLNSSSAKRFGMNRRLWLKTSALASTAALVKPLSTSATPEIDPGYRIQNGQIHQTIMGWTYDPMPTPDLARHCKAIGLVAMEGINEKFYPVVRELGLAISLVGSHGFTKGPFNPANHEFVERKLRDGIDLAVQVHCKNVITFTGMREPGITDEAGARNCVESWRRVIGYAEQQKINLCLEVLNSKVDHPDYQGDHTAFGSAVIERVGSPRLKLLYDIYHMQIMEGDVIRTIREHRQWIGHFHTGGVPGRHEIDDSQELNYHAVAMAIADTGFNGFIAHEFKARGEPYTALAEACRICRV